MSKGTEGGGKKVSTPAQPARKPDIHKHGYAPAQPAPQRPSQPRKK